MKKLSLLFFGLCHIALPAMEFKQYKIYVTPLKDLLAQGQKDLVLRYIQKYEQLRKRVNDLSHETNGVIAVTTDNSIAEKDFNKFFFRDVMEISPHHIEILDGCINVQDQDYKGPRTKLVNHARNRL